MSDSGFILTRRVIEVAGVPCIEFWLSTRQGPVRLVTEPQQPVFFIVTEEAAEARSILEAAGIRAQSRALELKTFDHQNVSALYFSKTGAAYQAQDILSQHGIVTFEQDIRLPERYLMERFVCANAAYTGRLSKDDGRQTCFQARLKPTSYSPSFRVLSLDIECSEQGELYCVGLVANDWQKVIMIGPKDADTPATDDTLLWVANEAELLQQFVRLVAEYDPDLIIGWNVINFDFRILIERAEALKVQLRLGRGGEVVQWRQSRADPNQGFVTMPGRVVLDGIDGLKTATYQFDSFSLEFVAQTLLKKGKETEDVENRLAAITHDFHHNKRKLADYNLQDCRLVLEIFEHTRLIDFLTLRSQLTGLELDRSGGSVAAFINLYLPRLHRAGYVSPNRPADGGLASPGGYVMNSHPGLYQHVLVLDFKSLYPSIIRTFKIDPLGLIEGLLHPDSAIPGFKGACFDREKHFLPEIITSLWAQRDEAKQQKDSARSQAIKILMNSFYGVLGSGGCPFYDTRLASSITMRGHEIMQQTAKWIEQRGYKVIYGDTDSTFVWLNGQYTNHEAQTVGRELASLINQKWQAHIADNFQLESLLEIEFETHFEQFLMPTIRGSEMGSKKRYAGLKSSKDGAKMVFKGLETVRSDWTELAKQFQQNLYARVFAGQDVKAYIRSFIADTRSGKLDDLMVYRKRLRQPLDKYVKNVPPHVRAARLAQQQDLARSKASRFSQRRTVEYVITTQGPEPVEYRTGPLDYDHYVERQLAPVAEAILPFIGLNFQDIASSQMGLF